jgi:hypothetical protein
MTYTLDRFPAPEDQVVLDAYEGLQRLSGMVNALDKVLDNVLKKRADKKEAAKAMLRVVNAARSLEESGAVPQEADLTGKLLEKALTFVGKRLLKAIVRPILQFAGRMAMNLVRMSVQAAARFVIIPALEATVAVAGFLFTNPIGWGILAAAAVGAGLYYFGKEIKEFVGLKQKVVEVEANPTGAVVGEATPEVIPPAPTQVPKEEPLPTIVDRVVAPVERVIRAAEEVVRGPTQYVEKSKGKFKGFGEDMDGYIRETSQRFPILPLDELRGFIKMEAGWTGQMSPTGAIGTGQFTAGTWNALIRQGGAALGMEPITGIFGEQKGVRPRIGPNPNGNFRTPEDPRFDRRINTLATGLLASQNAEMLRRAGLPITGGTLYMMHNIGPGIIPVMQGRPASPATLKAMRQNGMLPNMTDQEFLAFQTARYERARMEANQSTQVIGDVPGLTPGTTVEPTRQVVSRPSTQRSGIAATPTRQQGDLVRGPGNSIVRTQ